MSHPIVSLKLRFIIKYGKNELKDHAITFNIFLFIRELRYRKLVKNGIKIGIILRRLKLKSDFCDQSTCPVRRIVYTRAPRVWVMKPVKKFKLKTNVNNFLNNLFTSGRSRNCVNVY